MAYVLGDRDEATCRKLWRAIPQAYQRGTCYTDFWKAYQAVIPSQQHQPGGKETGETAHIERRAIRYVNDWHALCARRFRSQNHF